MRRHLALALAALFVLAALPSAVQAQYFRYGKNKVQYEDLTWSYLQSRHFDIYYYQGGEELAQFTAEAAEDAYRDIERLFDHEIADRIAIIVYQSHNDFAVTNVVDLPIFAEGIGGVTELYKNRVALPFTGDYRDYRRVVHHELIHAVINDMFYGGSIQNIIQNNIQLRIPTWFNEGLAEYSALGWDTNSDMYVREAVLEDDLAPIPRLRGYFAYRGGQSVWDYVAEQYGEEKVAEVLTRLRTTRSVNAAFKRAIGLDLEELSERWQDALKEVYYPELAARERLREVGRAVVTRDENGGAYNTSPAISPQGDRIVYITTKDGLFDVYLARASDGETLKKLVDGQTDPQFESLRILSPGTTWGPEGERVALAVKAGPSDAIAVIDVESGDTRHYRVPGIDQIVALAWAPEGDRIAFAASKDAQSDVYVLTMGTGEVVNVTNDVFSDHAPAWTPDGEALVFHSDRGAYTQLGAYQPETFSMTEHDYGQFDLYRATIGAEAAERLTSDEVWDEYYAQVHPEGDILFISDRNGIPNLYALDPETGVERPLTDLAVGLTQFSLSADGRRAAVVALHEGTPSIYVLREPLERDLGIAPLRPTVWAQRVMQEELPVPAPTVALASEAGVQRNPFLRDATDGTPYPRERGLAEPGFLADFLEEPADTVAVDTTGSAFEGALASADPEDGAPSEPADTTSYGEVQVDFRNYVFGEGYDEVRQEETTSFDGEVEDPFQPEDHVAEDGSYKPKRYKLVFSPDIVVGAAQYDIYGVQGVTQMMFSDELGNHQVGVATNLLLDLRNSDYMLSYGYLANRTDYGLVGYHTSRILSDAVVTPTGIGVRYIRYRTYGAGVSASYPFDKFRRVDANLAVLGVSQADLSNPNLDPVSRVLLYPSLTFTKDVTTPGFITPGGGYRLALSLTGSPGNLVMGDQVRFASLLGDARAYTSFFDGFYSFAFRASGGASFGPDQQLFYTSGVQNWINRDFDNANGFPVDDISDFLFATPVLPLRGYDINEQNGSYFGLLNAEARMPLIAAILPGPIPLLPLYNIQATAFVDAGAVWGGRSDDKRLTVFADNAAGERVLDDVLVGTGFGLRTIFLGYPIRLDWAWPFDGQHFGDRQLHFSFGVDF